MPYDYAIHSDFLIHWTGKDLDDEYDKEWANADKSSIPETSELHRRYIARLRDTLKHGLWQTAEPEQTIRAGTLTITIPSTPKMCFTELKVSESRRHAKRYGRLGIGVRRPYLFQRCGRPLAYYGFGDFVHNDRFLTSCADDLRNQDLLNFFKPMNSSAMLNYDLYSESEWRIVFMQELLDRKLIVDPRDSANLTARAYFQSLPNSAQDKLRYPGAVRWMASHDHLPITLGEERGSAGPSQ
jgi:hypothetical protein